MRKSEKEKIFDSVESCIADFAAGRPLIVTDDENRENEGDLIVAGEKIDAGLVNMLVTDARGLLCVPMTSARLTELGIDDMVRLNRDSKGTAFTVTVDAAKGISTGISAADRARTIRILADPKKGASDIVSPGHVNPLRARLGGVLERAGHTEAAVDLARLAGLSPCAAICEIMNPDGTMARLPQLLEFAKKRGLKIMSVASLIEYRLKREKLVSRIFSRALDTKFGEFKFMGFSSADKRLCYALVKGKITKQPTFARVHSQNIFSDLLCAAGHANSAASFARAMEIVSKEGGALVYIDSPNSGVEPATGEEIVPTMRDYGLGAQILRALGFGKIKLLTTHVGVHSIPDGFGLKIVSETDISEKRTSKKGARK